MTTVPAERSGFFFVLVADKCIRNFRFSLALHCESRSFIFELLPMLLGILREPDHENRVSITPDVVKQLVGKQVNITIETEAGLRASLTNEVYQEAGASVQSRADVLAQADIVVSIQPLTAADTAKLKPGAILFGMYQPLVNRERMAEIAAAKTTLFSMDAVPRITRAQAMDVLSSQSTVSGYKAVLLAASHLPRFFPMLMTAAGTIAPAKVLIIGAGVAGLQAIATAKRLGAVVEAFDTRPSVKEQVESLGGKFVEVEGAVEDKAAGGYAVEQSEEFKRRQSEELAKRIVAADVVITTALIPGKKAPVLITEAMVRQMKAGAVIVDLASGAGGNCELTREGETRNEFGVSIIPASNLPATMPQDASKMYAKNMLNFLNLMISKEGELKLNFEDEIIQGSCIAHGGEVVYPALKQA